MPWDINSINEFFMNNLPHPAESFDQGRDEEFKQQAIRTQFAQQQQDRQTALAIAAQKVADRQKLAANPTPQAYSEYYLRYPEDKDAIKESWGTRSAEQQKSDLREVAAIHGYLSSGNVDQAKRIVQRRIDADKTAGLDTADDEELLSTIDEDPQGATGVVRGILAAIADPEKVADSLKALGENARADETQPSVVQKAAAEASIAQTTAEFAPRKAASDLADASQTRAESAAKIADMAFRQVLDRDKLELDRDTLTTNVQLSLEKMDREGIKLTGVGEQQLTKSVTDAASFDALANRTKSLADEISASDFRGGWLSGTGEYLKAKFGGQDAVSVLRSQYDQLVNSQATKNLPPGPASDKDIALALKGVPPSTAPKEYIVGFLRGMEKLQRINAAASQAQADWISANGNLGTAKRDMNVGGVLVPSGTTYGEFNRNRYKMNAAPPPRSYIRKYGGGQ